MTNEENKAPICGIWADNAGKIHLSQRDAATGERNTQTTDFHPFAWTDALPELPPEIRYEAQSLNGEAPLNQLLSFNSAEDYSAFLKARDKSLALEHVKPLEHQFLLQKQLRLFEGIRLDQLKRCQLDIETHCATPGGFSNATRPEDRVLAIGLRMGDQQQCLLLEELTDEAEKKLLESLNTLLQHWDPDIIEGHNIFKFDLNYLKLRCKKQKVPCQWGRFGQKASFRNSRLRIAERWIDYPRCDLPGRTVFDTYLMIQLFDITTRDLTSYTLKNVALYFGVTDPQKDNRTYIEGSEIQKMYVEDRARFIAYLEDDLRETQGVADILLPTYFAQVQNFPMLLQEACLRGTANKVDIVFLDKYYHAREALPFPPEVSSFAGGFTKSFETGVFKNVLHFDVASLYPSLLMLIERNPENDSLQTFIPLLKNLREYRLKYKELARTTEDNALRKEYNARQASFKILINSFYGYLGFPGARFADSELASEVTARGRELLQALITKFQEIGCTVLEADTDGIYLSPPSDELYEHPERLLQQVTSVLPTGIELEYDGAYLSMFCYKAKNYALYDGKKVLIRGSALRSRGTEPFLKTLTDGLISSLLGAKDFSPTEHIAELRKQITQETFPVEQLAKSEYLSQNPEKYKEAISSGSKPRRASLEVALQMTPTPRMGERVSYYITIGAKKRLPDWQTAKPIEQYNGDELKYDPTYYLRKLDDWIKRYENFLEKVSDEPEQFELF